MHICGSNTATTEDAPCNPKESNSHDCDLPPHNDDKPHECGCGFMWYDFQTINVDDNEEEE